MKVWITWWQGRRVQRLGGAARAPHRPQRRGEWRPAAGRLPAASSAAAASAPAPGAQRAAAPAAAAVGPASVAPALDSHIPLLPSCPVCVQCCLESERPWTLPALGRPSERRQRVPMGANGIQSPLTPAKGTSFHQPGGATSHVGKL